MLIEPDQLQAILDSHLLSKNKTLRLYKGYLAEDLPIQEKTRSSTSPVNNKLINPFRSQIIDQLLGYLFGKGVSINLDSLNYEESQLQVYDQEIQHFLTRNSFDDLCNEAGLFTSCCGYAAWLVYLDKEGKERVMVVPPWECLFLSDPNTDEDTIGIRYFNVLRKNEEGEEVTLSKVEVYDSQETTFYIQSENGFILDPMEESNPLPNVFNMTNLIRISNNREEKGDYERCESLIDALDKLISSGMDEIESFSQAYLVVKGAELDSETIKKAQSTGAFSGLEPEDSISFVIKDINGSFFDSMREYLETAIYKHSSSIDFSHENFAGSSESGESRKWKLLNLENRSINLERKFTKSLRDLFKVVSSSWNKKSININWLDIWFQFNRNIPVDLLYSSEISKNLMGTISEESRLSLLPFVDDVSWELSKMAEDRQTNTNLDTIVFAKGDADGGTE